MLAPFEQWEYQCLFTNELQSGSRGAAQSEDTGRRRELGSSQCFGAREGRVGTCPASSEPPPTRGPGTSSSGVCCSVLIQDFSPCRFSTVEYPLPLLHGPPAPVVKRPGAMAAHHPLQVEPCAHRPLPFVPSPRLCYAVSVSAMLSRHARPTLTCVLSVLWWGLLCHAPLPDLLDVPQEASQPLNLTAKPKAPELPNTSSSPSLKLGTCGPRPPSHGAAPRDRPPSPPSLPLGKLSAPCLVASSWGESTRGPDLGQHVLSLSGF